MPLDKLIESTIGNRIQLARKANKLRQNELAQRIGVSTISINRYENDHRIPSSHVIKKMAEVLDCNPGWILAGEERVVVDSGTANKIGGTLIEGYEDALAQDPVLREILDLLIYDLPEIREQILKILAGRKQVKEGFMALDIQHDRKS